MKKKNPPAKIRKKSRKFENFNEKKYLKSLRRSGLNRKQQLDIFKEVNEKDYFSTTELHKETYKALLKRSRVFAANYNIKQAIYNLGPTGYPFEILCAEMLKAKGFQTKVSVMKRGKFVRHEVDVMAKRADLSIWCECKFHEKKTYKNDIKIPLYVHSRYLDLKEGNPNEDFRYALISNTDFSKDAIRYASGVGLLLYSMNHPKKGTFCDIIKKYKVYPITALKSLRVRDRKQLLEKGVVVIKQVQTEDLKELGLQQNQITKVQQEIKLLTRPN